MIHCCDTCERPILIYGRMIPCKHVFCLACAHEKSGSCSRCGDKVIRVEQAGLGSIFMCTHGGSRYGNDGCRRTYLSQRDLQAHIQHRHVNKQQQQQQQAAAAAAAKASLPALPSAAIIAEATAALVNARNKGGSRVHEQSHPRTSDRPGYSNPPGRGYPPAGAPSYLGTASNISVLGNPAAAAVASGGTTRQSNLITVPIQDKGGDGGGYYGGGGGGYSQPPPGFYTGQNAASSSYEASGSSWRTANAPPGSAQGSGGSGYYRR